MSLDGLRAWIGEVERKLGMRTRVFLVLAVIAIAGAGAAIYLAIDARDSSVSEGDVQALQEQLEEQIDEEGGTGVAGLKAEVEELRTQVEQMSGESGASNKSKEGNGSGTSGPTEGPGSNLKQLLEQTQKQNEQAEKEQSTE